MNYKALSVWIFVVLILTIFLMIVYPSDWVIGFGVVGLPVLVILQVILVLKAREGSTHTFDDRWYDDK